MRRRKHEMMVNHLRNLLRLGLGFSVGDVASSRGGVPVVVMDELAS